MASDVRSSLAILSSTRYAIQCLQGEANQEWTLLRSCEFQDTAVSWFRSVTFIRRRKQSSVLSSGCSNPEISP